MWGVGVGVWGVVGGGVSVRVVCVGRCVWGSGCGGVV